MDQAIVNNLHVDCGKEGKFVIMEEPEYQILLEALKRVLGAVSVDEQIQQAIQAVIKKAGNANTNN